jgi:hypothetical protein
VYVPLGFTAVVDGCIGWGLMTSRTANNPKPVSDLVAMAVVGALLGVPYWLIARRSYRRHHAEWVEWLLMGIVKRATSPLHYRLMWPSLLMMVGLLVAGQITSSMFSGRPDAGMLLLNALLAAPLAYREYLSVRTEALAREREPMALNAG